MRKELITQEYDGKLLKVSASDLINELANRYPYVCIIDNNGNRYQLKTEKGGTK